MKQKSNKSVSKGYYYVTTPIYYANGHPHLGNTYTTTLADSLTRFYQYLGRETFFLTGTDEHGDKVLQAATQAGKSAQEFTDEVSDLFRQTWQELGLEYTRFIRTTEPRHKEIVKQILQTVYDKGDIYFGEYSGLYCLGCERFLTEKELVDEKCPDHQTKPQVVSEKNYFFKMSKYQEQLVRHITEVSPTFIRPERYKNEVLAMLREPLEDLCISRPKSRLTWGIELPFDNNFVTYVWFDALINYLTGIDFPDGELFKKFWPEAEHLIAKDIVKPHAIFWPTMLMSAGIPLYRHLSVHGYWVTPTGKMSKSLGNVVDPIAVKNEFSMDVFRYFVLREMTFGLDGTFSREALEARYSADLANNLGNLVSRTLAMVHKYRSGEVPNPGNLDDRSKTLSEAALNTTSLVSELISGMEIHRALEVIWKLIDEGNIYIDRTKPWVLAKEETSSGSHQALNSVLYAQLELLRIISGLLTAFLPETSKRILGFLGFDGDNLKEQQTVKATSTWGMLRAGVKIAKGEILFPRIDKKETITLITKGNVMEGKQTIEENRIGIDEFSRIDLRVGQVLKAERVEKSEKLLKLIVEVGEPYGERQIVAGIGKHYTPEELIGRKVAVVANLKPAKLMGNLSEGMLLAASDNLDNLQLLSVSDILPPGSKIK